MRGRLDAFLARRFQLCVWSVFVLALAIRVGATATFVGLSVPPRASASPDQVEYEELAWRLSQGHGFTWSDGRPTAARPPGTPLTLAPIYAIAGRSWLAGRLWFAFLSAATCLLLMAAIHRVLGPLAAVAAGLGLALYPGHWYHCMHFLSEVPYAFFVSAFFAALLGLVRRPRIGLAAVAGVSLACATLVRPNALVMFPLAAVVLLWSSRSSVRAVIAATVMGATVVAVTGPWLYRNHQVMGVATFSTVGGWTFWGSHNERVLNDPHLAGSWVSEGTLADDAHPLPGPTEEVRRSQVAWTYGRTFVERHLSDMPYLVAMKIYRLLSPFAATENRAVYWAFATTWCLVAPFVVVGWWRWWRYDRPTAAMAMVPLLGAVLGAAIFYGSVRFRDAVAPVFFACAGASLMTASRERLEPATTSVMPRRSS